MAEDPGSRTKEGPEDKKNSRLWWCFAIILLIFAILAGLGVTEYQEFHKEKAGIEGELLDTKTKLASCLLTTKAPPCIEDPATVVKPRKKVRRYHAPKPPVVKQKIFDPKDCGYGTEAGFNKETGKPECRAIPTPVAMFVPAPMPAPVVARVEIPKPEMKCEKPLIRELREDGSIACIALPATQQPVTQSPSGCYTDSQGRLMCPREREARSSGSSWVPWAIGGAAVLAFIANNRHRGGGGNSSPGPGVTTLPPGPGVVTQLPGPGVVTQ